MEERGIFYNDGSGWTCRPCESELSEEFSLADKLSREFRNGESECRNSVLANPAPAKWTDATCRFLTCPRCGITEPFELA